MPALEARGVYKTFDRVRYVLEDVSFSVEAGELLVLMGRSGSGKTTLLNLLAGLDEPSEGQLLVEGQALHTLDEEARSRLRLEKIGVVFQRFHLIPELTLHENVRLPMQFAEREDARERTRELLTFFGLEEQAQDFPSTLSGGESQRAAIARALANEPAVLLADEPTANLDETNADNALDALRRVAEELGTAVLMATHDPLARDAGDRVLHLVDGRIRDRGGALAAGDVASTGSEKDTDEGAGAGPPGGGNPSTPEVDTDQDVDRGTVEAEVDPAYVDPEGSTKP